MPTIPGDPYAWPFDGNITPQNTALIIIDMQTDFAARAATSMRWATTCR